MRASYLLFALSMTTFAAQAQDAAGSYVGLSYGNLDYEEYDEEFDEELFSETGEQLRLFGGYRFGDHFALEAGWGKTTGLDDSFSGNLPGLGDVVESLDAEIETLTIRAVGIIPFDHLSLFGAAGYYDASVSGSYSYSDDFFSEAFTLDHLDDSGLTVAAGMQFDFDSGLSLRGEAEWFDTPSDITAYAINLGVLFYFGQN